MLKHVVVSCLPSLATYKKKYSCVLTSSVYFIFCNNIKIYIKTAPTCFGAVTPSSGSALVVLSKVTVVKIVH